MVFNKVNTTIVDVIIGSDWVFHVPGGLEFKGRKDFKQTVTMLRNAFPDLHIAIENVIAVRYIIRGTFRVQILVG
jgi:hypothetical protein